VLAKQTKQTTTKKAKYPLGNIPHLIPHNVVRESDQQAAIDEINQQKAPDRFKVFTTPVDVATPQARLKVIAILYHYEQVWYAAWLPPKQQANEYVYGHAYAFKNTSAAAKTTPHHIWNSKDKCVVHEIGRSSQLFTYSMNITRDDIIVNDSTGWRSYQWQAANLHCQKGRNIIDRVTIPFEKSLRENIPTWSDSRGIFDRLRCNNIFDAVDMPTAMSKVCDQTQGMTVDNLINAANKFKINNDNDYMPSIYSEIIRLAHIISKPAIKKLLQSELDRSTTAYNDPNNIERKPITQGFKTFIQVIESIDWINRIWTDCPIDYYQTYYNELRYIKLDQIRIHSINPNPDIPSERRNLMFIEWLREHMPVASLFTMLRKFLEQQTVNHKYHETGCALFSFFELNDTFSMAIRILGHGKELAPPKRWRINEFHDYVQAESWKIQNPNESLRQDLFPEPIRVTRNVETWSFFQPVDTHQLAMWGQAVRNCVGSASHYADDIKKRKHFIVLCMIDGKPTFTIQLVVDMGLMSVKQISGVANQRLTEDQREAYTEAFRQVLQQREKQLQSA
jgi:hypothetical protein